MKINLDSYIKNSQESYSKLSNKDLQKNIIDASNLCIKAVKNNNKIMLCGNGGSAADSQHIAGELMSKFLHVRNSIAAIALTTDTSIITSISNDFNYETIFSRQIEGIGQKGDVIFLYSTSGLSPNIINAAKTSQNMGISIITITGSRQTKLHEYASISIKSSSSFTPIIQQDHLCIGHAICFLIEQAFITKK